MIEDAPPDSVRRPVRYAVLFAMAGLICVLLFLVFGFAPWSVGLGVFLGFPLLMVAVVLYLVAVVRDLRRRNVL